MKTMRAKFEKGLYRFMVEIENKNERKDSEQVIIFCTVTSKKEANALLKGMIRALEYDGQNQMKYAEWAVANNWNQL